MPKTKFDLVTILLEIEERTSLLILLAADGTVNRMGYGTEQVVDAPLCIGLTDGRLFREFEEIVPGMIFDYQGAYDVKEKSGKLARLRMMFADSRSRDARGFDIQYGTDSVGVPTEIAILVERAVNLTDSWYQEQQHLGSAA
jgi:hypothetical protein